MKETIGYPKGFNARCVFVLVGEMLRRIGHARFVENRDRDALMHHPRRKIRLLEKRAPYVSRILSPSCPSCFETAEGIYKFHLDARSLFGWLSSCPVDRYRQPEYNQG